MYLAFRRILINGILHEKKILAFLRAFVLCLFWPLSDSLIEFIVPVSFNLSSHLAEVITLLVKWFSGYLPGSSSP